MTKYIIPMAVIYCVCLIYTFVELSTGLISPYELSVVFAAWIGGFTFAFLFLEIIKTLKYNTEQDAKNASDTN